MTGLRLFPMALLSVLLISAVAAAASDPATIPDSYASAATRVTLGDARMLNMRCVGKGERVVLFEAGANADSSTWYRVLPLLKGKARACAYDRAGYGFSDEGPLPRDLEADVADLHALIVAARFRLPLVLVGHSLGSNIVRLYVQRFPQDVAGMLLIDPPTQGEDESMPASWKQDDVVLRERRDALLDACASSAESGTLAPGCLRATPAWMSERVAAAVTANKSRPAYWRTLRSELAGNQAIFSRPVPAEERYGDNPLVLLSAEPNYEGVAEDARLVLEQARTQTQQRILAGSARSRRIEVPGASHDIQLDRPEAVASAVGELLDATPVHAPATRADR